MTGDKNGMSNIQKDFVRNLEELLDEHGWSQTKLASMAGLTDGAISNYRNGKTAPQMDALMRIAKAFDVTVSRLLVGEGQADTVIIRREKVQPTGRDIVEHVRKLADVYTHWVKIPADVRDFLAESPDVSDADWDSVRKILLGASRQKPRR